MSAPHGLIAAHLALKAWLLDALTLWAASAQDPGGGWADALTFDLLRADRRQRCRTQARQAWVYSLASRLGWTGEWRAPMRHGLLALQARHRRADGLYRATSGREDAALYDQAFVLLALAHAHAAGEPGAQEEAEALLSRLPPDRGGGFAELGGGACSANSNMHLFEAFQAWHAAGGGSVWAALADRQAELVQRVLMSPDTGAVIEDFAPGWTPLPRTQQTVDPGHQFEWAWLLMRWSQVAGRGEDLRAALGLVDIGERFGVDPVRGVAFASLDADLGARNLEARLWPQTERIKTNALAASLTGDPACWAAAEAAAGAILRYLHDAPVRGLWRERMDAVGAFVDEPPPTTTLYHLVGAVAELDRVLAEA